MKYTMKLLEEPFNNIENGTKTIEFRLYDEKRKNIKIGDTIEFLKLPNLEEKIITEVMELYRADTFLELFKRLYNNNEEAKRKANGMYDIYSREEEQRHGVLGMKIKVL